MQRGLNSGLHLRCVHCGWGQLRIHGGGFGGSGHSQALHRPRPEDRQASGRWLEISFFFVFSEKSNNFSQTKQFMRQVAGNFFLFFFTQFQHPCQVGASSSSAAWMSRSRPADGWRCCDRSPTALCRRCWVVARGLQLSTHTAPFFCKNPVFWEGWIFPEK